MDDKQLQARIKDAAFLAEKHNFPRFIGFLDQREKAVALSIIKKQKVENYCFFGGFSDAQRTFLAISTRYIDILNEYFPFVPLTFTFRSKDLLAHRDFYGAILNLQIKKESVGDILVGEGYAVVFLTEPVSKVVLENITKVGNVGVNITVGKPDILPKIHEMLESEYVVSSQRLDCIVASITGKSRSISSKMIKSNLVSVNFLECSNISYEVKQDDILSVRGYGRFIFSGIKSQTRKEKIRVKINKFI